MRLFRGLSKSYNPDEVRDRSAPGCISTNFTDCPYAALEFARGPKGTVLVLDVPEALMTVGSSSGIRVTQELWHIDQPTPRRFVVWGRFEALLRAEIPAKTLRAEVRRKGIQGKPDHFKSSILRQFIETFARDRVS